MENSKIAKISLVISVIALAASITVLIISLTGNKTKTTDTASSAKKSVTDSTASGIAYVNLDTLLLEYKYSIKLNEDFLTAQAKAQGNFEARMRSFETKANAFQEKVRLNSFISQASMDSQQKELVQEQTNLQNLQTELSETLMQQQTDLNKELFDSVMNFVKEFNQERYTLILGNGAGSNILYAEPDMDITREVIDKLNERYAKSQAGK